MREDDQYQAAESPPTEYTDNNPWYIYECLPFLKEISGFPDYSNDAVYESAGKSSENQVKNSLKHNQALVDFIRHTNKNPLDMVNEFLASKKTGNGGLSLSCSPSDSSGSSVYSASYEPTTEDKVGKGFVVKKRCAPSSSSPGDVAKQESERCCSTPWADVCSNNEDSDCFQDFFTCDGGKVFTNFSSASRDNSFV